MPTIDTDIAFNEDAPSPSGTKTARVILIPFSDFKKSGVTLTIDTGVTEEITAFVLDSGDEGFSIEVPSPKQVNGRCENRETSANSLYNHFVEFIPNTTVEKERIMLARMRYQKVVAVLDENDGRGKLYGRFCGLKLISDPEDVNNNETGGSIPIVLATDPDGPGETAKPKYIASTVDLSTLLTPAA